MFLKIIFRPPVLIRGAILIKYICRNCDGLSCETSICPVCGQRTLLSETAIYYCEECNVPVFEETCECCGGKCKKIGSDLKAVFAQERLLLEIFLGEPMKFAGKSVWATSSSTYWVDGNRVKIDLTAIRKTDPKPIIDKINQYKEENAKYIESDLTNEHIQKFIECNKYRLNEYSTPPEPTCPVLRATHSVERAIFLFR